MASEERSGRSERARGDLRQCEALSRRHGRGRAAPVRGRDAARQGAGRRRAEAWAGRRRGPNRNVQGGGRARSGQSRRSRDARRGSRGSRPVPAREQCAGDVCAWGPTKRLAAMPWSATPLEILHGPSDGHDLNALSVAFAAVAETGTIALVSGADNPTTLNFLPDNQIVVVRRGDVVADYESVFVRLREAYGKGARAAHGQFRHRPVALGRYRTDPAPRRAWAAAPPYRDRRVRCPNGAEQSDRLRRVPRPPQESRCANLGTVALAQSGDESPARDQAIAARSGSRWMKIGILLAGALAQRAVFCRQRASADGSSSSARAACCRRAFRPPPVLRHPPRLRRRSCRPATGGSAPAAGESAPAERPGARREPDSRGRAGAAEAEEAPSAPAAARDRSVQRSRAYRPAQYVLRHRQGVRALWGDRRRRRLADRHRRAAPRRQGTRGGDVAQAPGDRGRSRRRPRERAGVGRRSDRGGQALPGARRPAADGRRRGRDAEGDQCAGEGAVQRARLQRQPSRRSRLPVRRPLCRGEPALDLGRGDRKRPRRPPLRRHRRRPRASLARDRRPYPGHQPQSDLDRADIDHQEGNHSAHAARSGLSHSRQDPHPRRLR